MAMIDTVGWKAFRLGDLFNIVRGTSRTMRMLDEGDIPVIAAARADQGVAGCYDVKPEYEDAITISCNGVGCGSVFYHGRLFAITGDASVMQEKQKMSRVIKLFIAAVCDSLFSVKYSYAEKCNPVGLAEEMIYLPATPDGQPDWAYMDAYMGEVLKKEEVFAEHLASLTAEAVVDGHPLDTSAWKAFRIGELFEVEPMRHKLSKADIDDGCVPIYSSDSENYGILGYTSNDATYKITASKPFFVVFGDHTCNMSVVQTDFCVADNVKVLSPKVCISETALLFLLTTWKRNIKKLGYARHWSVAKDTDIYLPVTADGTPDWAWMEQYMQRQMDKAAALVEHLDAVWN